MKCPHSNNEPEFSPDNDEYVLGEGRFFELEIKAEQEPNRWAKYMEREPVFGCPRCGVMFMERYYERPQ